MDYVDFTLVRLADEASRGALFDQTALEQLAQTAYDADAMLLGGPYTAVFDELVVGLSVPRRTTAEAVWGPIGGGERIEGRLTLLGAGGIAGVRVDALWRGALVARAVTPQSRIQRVQSAWSVPPGVDHEIAASLQLEFSAPSPVPPAARRLPIAVAILVRDTPIGVASLLADSKLVRDHLRELGVERAREPGMLVRQPLVVAWMVPDATFDDADWPGPTTGTPEARRDARRAAAGRWLAREGIGLITAPAHGAPP